MRYQARLGILAAENYDLPQYRMRVFLWGAQPTQIIIHLEQDRVMSIRENARLQGFPDYYKLFGPIKQRLVKLSMCSILKSLSITIFRSEDFKKAGGIQCAVCLAELVDGEKIVGAIQRILYATEDSPSVLTEAQAMILQQQNQLSTFLSPIAESIGEKPKNEAQKRKDISNFEVDLEASSKSTPRQRLSDISNILDDSPIMNY